MSSNLLEEASLGGVTFTLPHHPYASRGIAAAVAASLLAGVLYGVLGPAVTPLTQLLSLFVCISMLRAMLSRFRPNRLRLQIAHDQVSINAHVGWLGRKKEVRLPTKGLQLSRTHSTWNANSPLFTLTVSAPGHPPVQYPAVFFSEAELIRMMTVAAEHQEQANVRAGEGQKEVPAALKSLQEQSTPR